VKVDEPVGSADGSRLDGHYFSFKTGGDPAQVVDRFEARTSGNRVTYYRNGPVGSKSKVNSATANPMESYEIRGNQLIGPVKATVDPQGDIVYSHGYTSRKEGFSPPRVVKGTVVTGASSGSAFQSQFEYKLNTAKMNWQDHEAAAVAWGGHLASISSKAENDHVTKPMQDAVVPVVDHIAYTVIESTGDQMADACEARGMAVIETIEECNAAAEALGLFDPTPPGWDTSASKGIGSPRHRPYGCVWNRYGNRYGRLQLNLNKHARQRGTAPDNTVKQICGTGHVGSVSAMSRLTGLFSAMYQNFVDPLDRVFGSELILQQL
jgi:hypothetical protein